MLGKYNSKNKTNNEFLSFIAVDFKIKTTIVGGKRLKLTIWVTCINIIVKSCASPPS
ncbi:hypothetical protein MTR_4g025110 [Medicago truncatula]|uniref:Uncharacterized protein n=1 Tax=Medicago truncatula TaxID=3880 RepID=G7JFV4_MEDTR|nr:hypothetical protein MTR_4g025110 [Medicago truncatula]